MKSLRVSATAFVAVGLFTGCVANNVHDLRMNPTETLRTHSADSVPVTAQRIAVGTQPCESSAVNTDVYGANTPADVHVDVPGSLGFFRGPTVNARVTPSDTGSNVEISYRYAGWKSSALRMKRLAEGKSPAC